MDESTTNDDWRDEARARTDEFVGAAKERINQARSEFESIDRELRTFVKERPIVAMLGAIVTGYVVGRLFSRR